MEKLINGILSFRKNAEQGLRDKFEKLADGQSPDALFIACSDSRVVPNTFASTNPGDLFVHRNVGNLIPKSLDKGLAREYSEVAGLEFALGALEVKDIIVCGHSNCGAMQALLKGREAIEPFHLKEWLRHGDDSLTGFQEIKRKTSEFSELDQLSQFNVLTQLNHLRTYELVRQKISEGKLRLHAWWFDIKQADVYIYDQDSEAFVLLDEKRGEQLLRRIKN